MRIRRRPQAQALIPSPLQQEQASDPSQPPGSQLHWLPQKEANYKPEQELHLHRPQVDLGVGGDPSPPARTGSSPPPHPQGDNVVGRRDDAEQRGDGGARRQAGPASHGSLENGHRGECDWPVIDAAGEPPVNGVVIPAMLVASMVPLNKKEGIKSDGSKRRRGPAVLLEGSRCSRVNGRGWRCSQPTLVGYSLCEHHLGKGRQSRRANNGGGGGGPSPGAPKLGRTEPNGRKSAAPLALVVAAPDVHEPVARLAAEFS
ncbi:hypothetical protein QYE76_025876 [Lolium multiflorum]|uniref:WRC domain-containing protein n=1 Tax=Lolium multiflorum TaxID=4521 RepID=A0AAD8VV15_LOLMU|nr:hypothetical protein QYE76_025876 [Lolium multiflorum]